MHHGYSIRHACLLFGSSKLLSLLSVFVGHIVKMIEWLRIEEMTFINTRRQQDVFRNRGSRSLRADKAEEENQVKSK
jgi:hypothetical protein